jgi:hypothetical protein
MPAFLSTSSKANAFGPARRAPFALAGLAAFAWLAAAPAAAQSASCQEFAKTVTDRQQIIAKLQSMSAKNKQMDPKAACSMFGSLVNNGTGALKWLDANKEWCQIPDQFVESFKTDHTRALDFRGKACKAASQQAIMEKKAKEGGSSGLLGGDGLTGSFKLPQGAL